MTAAELLKRATGRSQISNMPCQRDYRCVLGSHLGPCVFVAEKDAPPPEPTDRAFQRTLALSVMASNFILIAEISDARAATPRPYEYENTHAIDEAKELMREVEQAERNA